MEVLEEDAFRPVLHHYDGPKFCLELSVPEVWLNTEFFGVTFYVLFLFLNQSTHDVLADGYGLCLAMQTLDLLDLCEQAGV